MRITEATPCLARLARRFAWICGGAVLCSSIAGACAAVPPSSGAGATITCAVHPAVPDALTGLRGPTQVTRAGQVIELANGYLAVEISAVSGVITAVENKLIKERHAVDGDQTGIVLETAGGETVEWLARGGAAGTDFTISLDGSDEGGRRVILRARPGPDVEVAITYTLKPDEFWVERRLSITAGKTKYQTLRYGRADVPNAAVRELKLGKFDAPRLMTAEKGGIFAGVGGWFYEVNDGVYQNTAMNYETQGTFEAEPWYVGVFRPEAGEPYPGWLWYKTFLAERKRTHDKQRSYSLWNARSGYCFEPINNPDLLNFVDTASRIGLRGITSGQVTGLAAGTKLAATDPVARRVMDAYSDRGIDFGLHEGDVKSENWRTDAALAAKLQAIDEAARQGVRNLTVDFFRVEDHFADHRRVATFFRHIRDKMAYTECHLGMAVYGPQFQREVLINHPTDLSGFDIARFSSDWATLLGFRHSRREWQRRYQYLMPENGLFYFSTHYSAYPRRYQEPEPQQFLYIADAWRGLAYAFHDKVGFRDAVAAQSAFSTFYVFGFLDARMPAHDAAFAREYLAWVDANTGVLNRGRVCAETDHALVMSKIRDGRGALFAINYSPGGKRFKLRLEIPRDQPIAVRQIYPQRGETQRIAPGGVLETVVPGERLAIFEINDGLEGVPPENPRVFPIDVTGWRPGAGGDMSASFTLPDVRQQLAAQRDVNLPRRLVSADQTETEVLTKKNGGRGMGRLPREFLLAYGFEEEKFLPTWKAAPWALGDRVWFVYLPGVAPTLSDEKPTLSINGRDVPLVPRVRYEPRTRLANPGKWDVPMWFADVTDVCRYGDRNDVILRGANSAGDGTCYIAGTSAPQPATAKPLSPPAR